MISAFPHSTPLWHSTLCRARIRHIDNILTHWLLELLQKVRFLDISVIFRLDLGQITFDLMENAFATQQLAFLTISIAF